MSNPARVALGLLAAGLAFYAAGAVRPKSVAGRPGDPEIVISQRHAEAIKGLAFSLDGRWLAITSNEEVVRTWELASGRMVASSGPHAKRVKTDALSPGGQWLARARRDGVVEIWKVRTFREPRLLTGHRGRVHAVAFSPDGQWLASAGADRTVRLWHVAGQRAPRVLEAHEGAVMDVAFSPDGRWLATASRDRSLKLWDTTTGRAVRDLAGHGDAATAVIFSPAGDWLVSGSSDGTARLWEPETGRQAAVLSSMKGSDEWAVITPDRLFDGSPRALRELVAWRIHPSGTGAPAASGAETIPLDSFYEDLFYPGLLADLLEGRRPRAPHDISVDEAVVDTHVPESLRRSTARILSIGIDRYAATGYDLRHAAADARAFGEGLRRQLRGLGAFENIELVPMLDHAATRRDILSKLGSSSGGDAVFIYFSGHVITHGRHAYLVPHDLQWTSEVGGQGVTPNAPEMAALLAGCISDVDLARALRDVQARWIVMIIDGCDALQGRVVGRGSTSGAAAQHRSSGRLTRSRGLASLARTSGAYVLTSVQGYQAAREATRAGHGHLVHALLDEGIGKLAADRAPRDGRVDLREWLAYPERRVPQLHAQAMEEARRLGKELVFVDGEQAIGELRRRTLPRPRVFHPRDDSPVLFLSKAKAATAGG